MRFRKDIYLKNTHIYRVFRDMHLLQFLIASCIMALLLETILVKTVKPVQHYDEAIALLLGVIFLVRIILERHVEKDELAVIILTIFMVILGFAGNIRNDLVHSKYLWCLDAFNMFKFIAASLGAVHLFSRTKHNEYIIRYLALFTEIVIFVSTVFLFIHSITDIHMTTDIRYGFRTYHFIFMRVGDFYEACLYFLMILFADLYVEKRKITWLFIGFTILNMVSTFRSRPLAYAGLFILFYIAFVMFRVEKVKLRYAVPIVLAAAMAFAGQFVFYFSGDKARNILLRYGVRIMKAYFPIGSGFATYGTAVAKQYYSKLFLRYGFWRFYGTSMKNPNFLLDDYWPAIMAELGLFGAVFMLIVILLLFKRNIKACNNPYSRVCVYSCWLAMFISSTVSSAFLAGTKAMLMSALVCSLLPIVKQAAEAEDDQPFRDKFVSFWKNNGFLNRLNAVQRLVMIAAILGVFCIGVLGIRNRAKIQNMFFPSTVRQAASISVNPETMIFRGGEFDPYTEDILLKNARLRDISFRDKSVDFLRQVIGDRYYTLTDEEIEAVTGEKVINGLTKVEVMESSPAGSEADLSAFETVMSAEERQNILETSNALDSTFTLSGDVLRELLRITVATAGTGNFRDRFIYYYYTTYSGYRLQATRKLRLEGCHLPSMMVPETMPPVTRDMVKFEASSKRELNEKYTAFANYLGITSNNGFGGDGNEDITFQSKWDRYASQQLTVKFIHNTLYGLSVNRTFNVRIDGPEIILNDQGVTILKGSRFDPYDYVDSVLDEDGKNMMGLLEIDNQVDTNTPGFYNVTYSCGPNSIITLRVKVATDRVYYSLNT